MKKFATSLYAAIVVALMVWGFYQAIYVAPDDAMQGYVFRIIYYHVPSASVAFLFFAISLIGSIGFIGLAGLHGFIGRGVELRGRRRRDEDVGHVIGAQRLQPRARRAVYQPRSCYTVE